MPPKTRKGPEANLQRLDAFMVPTTTLPSQVEAQKQSLMPTSAGVSAAEWNKLHKKRKRTVKPLFTNTTSKAGHKTKKDFDDEDDTEGIPTADDLAFLAPDILDDDDDHLCPATHRTAIESLSAPSLKSSPASTTKLLPAPSLKSLPAPSLKSLSASSLKSLPVSSVESLFYRNQHVFTHSAKDDEEDERAAAAARADETGADEVDLDDAV